MKTFFEHVSKFWWQLTLFFLALITILSLTPISELPAAPGSDKGHHIIAYFTLALPAALHGGPKWFLLMPLFLFWSGAIELIQPLVNRHAEWLDLAANFSGLSLGSIVGYLIRRGTL
jgi:VanZ family protein